MNIIPTDVDRNQLRHLIGEEYSLRIRALRYGPQGEESYSLVGIVEDGGDCFVRLQRAHSFSSFEASMRRIVALRQRTKLREVVAPYRTRRKLYACRLFDYNVAVFPYVRGLTLHKAGASNNDIGKAARLIAKIHSADVSNGFPHLWREHFDNPFRASILRLLRDTAPTNMSKVDKYRRKVRQLVDGNRTTILDALAQMTRLKTQIRRIHPQFVVTHGDANSANFIKDEYGRLFLTDWGDLGLGPAERDLFHFSGKSLELFLKHYTRVRKNVRLFTPIFAFYFYRWALQEIADFCTRILYQNTSVREKTHAWSELQQYIPVPHSSISRDLARIGSTISKFDIC